MEQNKIKYFLYVRKSSEAEDRQVASIESQVDELQKLAQEQNFHVVKIFRESKSAKAPGRPIYNEMMARIKHGEAKGILCWKLDRLARNPIDGGEVAWVLQNNVIEHIQTYGRGYLPTDNVLMMSVEFGVANQFIIDLKANTKRGLRNKAKNGWLPTFAPLGYMNEKFANQGEKRIFSDPDTFDLIRKCWDLLFTGNYSAQKIYNIAVDEWKVRTKTGKKPMLSKFYYMFRNTFYYGSFKYGGEWYQGKHTPMITKGEFDIAQSILNGKGKPHPKTHEFAFTGLIRCEECGSMITAEEKNKTQKNGNKHYYVYYHCGKRKGVCNQKTIRLEKLEEQINQQLEQIYLPNEFIEWAMNVLRTENEKESKSRNKILDAQQKEYGTIVKKIDGIIDMRATGELTEEEFFHKKKELCKEKLRFQELLKDTDHRVDDWLEKAEDVFHFTHDAKKRFEHGSLEIKREILHFLGSNLSLKDNILHIELQKPFMPISVVAPSVRKVHERLELLNLGSGERINEKFEQLYARIPQMGG